MKSLSPLPALIAGPILRHVGHDHVTVWLVTSSNMSINLSISNGVDTQTQVQTTWPVGTHAFIHTVSITKEALLQADVLYHYDVSFTEQSGDAHTLADMDFKGFYPDQSKPSFRLKQRLNKVIHGSCRKAHFHDKDALPQLDNLIEQEFTHQTARPDIAIFTGDQVYVDDVAGPMLNAIHQTIGLLGLFDEPFEGATVSSLAELIAHPDGYYNREQLLPAVEANDNLAESFFKAKRKPVFTSVNAQNHLIALSEMLALYFLSWSASLWPSIDLTLDENKVNAKHHDKYQSELPWIESFKSDLDKVQRAMAHVPVYMIFDDHDVTDDWNLTRGWEEHIYGHPFSSRIIGNALAAYFLCQGCGNPSKDKQLLMALASETFKADGRENYAQFLDKLLEWDQWHYQLPTQPPVHVLDTRTQRWRSESSLNKPSGLMDWESLCELQGNLIGQDAVIMVSAAPVYGVKFIEAIQKLFTVFGGALVVDAENWMAHRGTASVMLNIFRHMKTPPNFIILSGDVHYSFVYDVKLRFRRNSPHITQFTSSGIHNQFPPKLIRWFDRLNRWFYGSKSPLNWLTKRRNMSVRQRKPIDYNGHLVNKSNLGYLTLNDDASHVTCELVCNDGSIVKFQSKHEQ